ncbi:uncharacterized protein [Spinacia oleracea]|uniref:Bifunctional inhibitor/plant lipid transfer protein/seed storage helical domain-containing protein n=1 Tax=Spinacia oleracea TaxID=3562 RepID=A0A9R0IUJ9_SPIOL|nr:uncharacterized protein LOC110795191 [Spinacia oleracea]
MKVVLIMIMVVVLVLCSLSSTWAQMSKMPPCVAKLESCSNKAMENTDFTSAEIPCCSEWAQEIKDNTQCVCDNFKPYLASLSDFFKVCKIDAPTCPTGGSSTGKVSTGSAISSNTNNGATNILSSTVGLILPTILLLVLTIILN